MNLHEKCLLKYLLNPIDLDNSTEVLKMTNELLKKGGFTTEFIAKALNVKYTAGSI